MMKRLTYINPFSKAMRYLLALLLVSSVGAFAQSDSDDDLEEVEGFTVTGSRVARLDLEPVSPVFSMTQESLEQTGFNTVGDALRSLSFNSGQALTPDNAGTSFTPGVSSQNLRNLGNNNTLMLINGRRVAPYAAPGFNGFQSVFDLNSVPASAIDSIEILKDGGSAIYGSDAVAGVINVKLRDDYEGLGVSTEIGDYFDTGGFTRRMSVNMGSISAKTSIFMSFNWEKQDAVFNRDLDFSDDADQTDRAHKADPEYKVYGLEASGMGTKADYLAGIGFTNPVDDGWFDNRSSRGYPGYLTVPGGSNVVDANGRDLSGSRITFSSPTANPTLEGAEVGSNLYNYQEASGLFPETTRMSFFTRGSHQITDWLNAFAEVSFSRIESEVHSAPATTDIENSIGIDPGTVLTVPSYNPYNVAGVDISNGRRRQVEVGNRINDVVSDTPRVLLGFEGDMLGLEGWTFDAGMIYTKNSVVNKSITASDQRLQMALNGLTRNGDGSFAWDPNTPLDEREYFNWFGLNEPAFADFIRIQNPTVAEIEMYNYDASIAGTLLELPAGQVGVAAGIEHRKEDFANIKTLINEIGGILGGSEGTSSFGSRDVTALYAEVSIPVIDMLEVQIAGRYEDYSDDGFKDEARPKLGFKFQPTPWLIARASYSEAFKAPDLAYLYTASQRSFSSNQVFDPVTQTQVDQIQIVTAGNPELSPETTDTYFAGISFEPGEYLFDGLLDGLSVSIEYYEFDQTNLLAQLSDVFSYQEFIQGDADGVSTFAGKVIRDSTNQILYLRDDYANIAEGEYEGWDFAASYLWTTEQWGEFYFQWNTTWNKSSTFDGSEQVGGYLTPEWRHNLATSWNYGDWGASLYAIYIDERGRDLSFGNIYTADDSLGLHYQLKTQILLNAAVSYEGLYDTKVTVGVNNLLNEEPPVDPFDGLGATAGVNYLAPAFWYIRLEREF